MEGSSERGEKLKVILLNSEKGMRGGEYQTLALAEGLEKRGCRVLLVPARGSELASRTGDRVRISTARFERIPSVTPYRIRNMIRDWSPDLIHAQTSLAHTHAGIASLFKRDFPPLIVSRRVAFKISGGLWGYLKYRRGADLYLAISKAVAEALSEGGVPDHKISIVPSGVDISSIRKFTGGGDIVSSWGFSRENIVIGALSPFEKEKGYHTLLKAAESVLEKSEDSRFVLAGRGRLENDIRRKIRSKGLEGRVVMVDPRQPIGEILSGFDIFVLASESEGLSTALISALAAGVPAVASRTGGIPEVLERGGGILVEPGDHLALAGAILELTADKDRRQVLAASAKEAADAFDIQKTVDMTYEIYRRVLE